MYHIVKMIPNRIFLLNFLVTRILRSYTSKATDWVLFLLIPCDTIEHAIFIESGKKYNLSTRSVDNFLQELTGNYLSQSQNGCYSKL